MTRPKVKRQQLKRKQNFPFQSTSVLQVSLTLEKQLLKAVETKAETVVGAAVEAVVEPAVEAVVRAAVEAVVRDAVESLVMSSGVSGGGGDRGWRS